MTNMSRVDKLVAKLNTVEAHVREWQRGGITSRERDARMGETLTQAEIDAVTGTLLRTTDRAAVASLIAAAIDL